MGLGILEDSRLERVPGTSPLNDSNSDVEDLSFGVDPAHLKHDQTGDIVLIPQPSDSPKDPYNWPRWKKEMFMLAILYGTGCVGAIGPLLTSALKPLAEEFEVPLQHMTFGLQGVLILCVSISGLFTNPIAVKIGKRPVYLLTTLGLALTCFWGGASVSFRSLAAARAVQGAMMAPFECLIPASIADVWFVHERGYRMALFHTGYIGGINLASPIAGLIIQYAGFRTTLYAMGGAFSLMLIFVIFCMPETAFHRSDPLDIVGGVGGGPTLVEENKVELEPTKTNMTTSKSSSVHGLTRTKSRSLTRVSGEQRNSYWKELLPYSGYWNAAPFMGTLVRPFFMWGSPIVLWASFLFTATISWLILMSFVSSQIFSAAPYNFSVSAVGATSIPSFVATILGAAVSGPIVDGLAKYMARRNKGIYEPEFRIPIMVAFMIFTGVGFFAWGESLFKQDPWPVPVILCHGMISLGAQLGATGVTAYVVDSHGQHAAEAFASMNFLKNLFAFSLTLYANDWIANQGVRLAFFTVGGITMGATLTTIPMYIFGKRARAFVWRHNLLSRSSI